MADPFVPPPGYTLLPPDAQPDPQPPGTQPTGTASPGFTPPPGYTSLPPGAQPDASYQGSILPFSLDASGKRYFDPSAGILGKAWDAFKLPGDVWTGAQPTPYQTGVPDPGLMARTANLAGFIDPQLRGTVPGRSPIVPPRVGSQPTPVSAYGGLGSQVVPTTETPTYGFGSNLVPTGQQLKAAADTGYTAARAAPTVIPSSVVASGATNLQTHLTSNFGLIPKTAPKTFDILDDLANPAGTTTDYVGLDAALRELKGIGPNPVMGASDKFAASQVVPHLEQLIDTISPEAATARANLAAAKRADDITGELTRGNTGILERGEASAAAANSGENLDNNLRQGVKNFLRNPDNLQGFSQEEETALQDYVKGGVFSNALRKVGNLLGGGGGMGALHTGAIGALAGHEAGGLQGAVIGGATPLVGWGLKQWENARASSQLDAIGQMIRSRSPLGEQFLNQNMRANTPMLNQAIMPGLLSPGASPSQPQPAGRYPPLPTTGPIPEGLLGPWA